MTPPLLLRWSSCCCCRSAPSPACRDQAGRRVDPGGAVAGGRRSRCSPMVGTRTSSTRLWSTRATTGSSPPWICCHDRIEHRRSSSDRASCHATGCSQGRGVDAGLGWKEQGRWWRWGVGGGEGAVEGPVGGWEGVKRENPHGKGTRRLEPQNEDGVEGIVGSATVAPDFSFRR